MNRLTRITGILIQLQSKKIVTAKEIAAHFEVSMRTIYRDIRTLQKAGVPIGAENGVGYFIVEGYRLPPISITEEEANALIVSEQFIQQQGDKSLSKNFDSLLFKIKSILKSFQKENIELLDERTDSFVKGVVYESNWLSEVQKSITNLATLQITYRSLYKEELTVRKIDPMAVYFTNNSWIVIAFCHLRQDLREFRLDRISTLSLTGEQFLPDAEFNLKNYFKSFQT